MNGTTLESLNVLIPSLQKYRDLVAASDVEFYYMNDFGKCVLGVHQFNGNNWQSSQKDAIEMLTGHVLTDEDNSYQFVGQRIDWTSDTEWLVIRLFTDHTIDRDTFDDFTPSEDLYISKENWLTQANDTLEKLEKIKSDLIKQNA